METNLSRIEVQAIKYTMYTTMYLNDLAINAIKELKPYILKDGAHKESQKMYNALLKKTHNYETMVKDVLGDYAQMQSYFYSEMDDKYDDSVNDLYDAIYDAIYPFLGEDTKEVAKSEIAMVLCELAVCFFNVSSKSCEQYSKKVHRLRYLCITDIYDNCKNLTNWITFLHRKKIALDLNKDKKVLDAFVRLRNIIEDADAFSNSITNSFGEYKKNKTKESMKKRVMVKLGNETKEFYDSIADCARFFKVSPTTIRKYAESEKKFKGIFTIKIVND